jgi:hypothetical protein
MRSQSGEGCHLVNDLASIMGSIYRWIATSSLRAASWRPWPVKRIIFCRFCNLFFGLTKCRAKLPRPAPR